MSTAQTNNFVTRKSAVFGKMKLQVSNKQFVEILTEMLSREREDYEDVAASEYARGRIAMLKELIRDLS